MFRLWKWYQNCVATHPVKTQAISSGLIWGVGEIAVQTITHFTANPPHPHFHLSNYWLGMIYSSNGDKDKDLKINWREVASSTLFGLTFVGAVGHFWYEGLEHVVRVRLKLNPNSFRFVGAKVAADLMIYWPLSRPIFNTYSAFCGGKSPTQVNEENVKRDSDFLPAIILGCVVFPIAQVAKFRFVPVRYQVLYNNCFSLLSCCSLSWLEQQEDAPWFKSYLTLKEEEVGQNG